MGYVKCERCGDYEEESMAYCVRKQILCELCYSELYDTETLIRELETIRNNCLDANRKNMLQFLELNKRIEWLNKRIAKLRRSMKNEL